MEHCLLLSLLLVPVVRGTGYPGLSDTTASVHRLFQYHLPLEASSIQVTEAGSPSLPAWLYFDQTSKTFLGVPHSLGNHYILLSATDQQGKDLKDVFSIEVVEGSVRSSCKDQSMAFLQLALDFPKLGPQRQVGLIRSLAGKIGRSPSDLQLVASETDSASPPGVVLRWLLDCPSENSLEKRSLEKLERSIEDGSLSRELDASVASWHLSANQQQSSQPGVLSREKRFFQHHQYNTPVPGVTVPAWFTSRASSAGGSETDAVPESRIVPTMSSPVFLGPSSAHPHRHHHGEGKLDKILPSEPYHRISAFYSTPIPFPERPTVLVSPSYVPHEVSSPFILPSILPSSSLMPTSVATERLPTSTLVVPPAETPAVSIQPTATVTTDQPTAPPVPEVTNVVPRLENHIQKLTMMMGKVWTFKIPADTFWDFEDGDTRNLKLFFYNSHNMTLPANSWIQFDPEEQELLALPMEEQIGTHEFILEAMDSEENTTNDRIEIDVWENPIVSKYHHSFIMSFKFDSWRFIYNLQWQMEIVKKLAEMYEDDDKSDISVLKITYNPHAITWTNDSLGTDHCPRQEIEDLGKLIIKESNVPTKAFKKKMQPDIRVHKVGLEFAGVCILPDVPFVVTTEKTTKDFKPRLFKPIDNITLTVGEVLRYRIPQDTFSDFEDGDTFSLKLSLLTEDERLPHKSSFILLDPEKRELFGLPLDEDAGEHAFYLAATDKDDLTTKNFFTVTVRPRSADEPPNFEMVFVLRDEVYSEFMSDLGRKVLLPWKIAHLLRDNTPKYVRVTSIRPGSVHVAWTNSSFPTKQCAQRKVQQLIEELIDDKKTISESTLAGLRPEFNITGISFKPLGPCAGQMHPINAVLVAELPTAKPPEILTVSPVTSSTTETINITVPETTEAPEADIFVTTIIPAIVIAVLLVIAAMVACFLYRKRRKMKNYTQDSSACMTKGVPIIFSDELEEKSGPAKAPMIMKEERGPLIPRHRHYPDDDENHESVPLTEPKTSFQTYHPPPPFAPLRDARGARPKIPTGYRQPPPYNVPP